MQRIPGAIVVGADGSESSTRALRWAAEQAAAERRPLALVHTIHTVTPAFVDAALVDARTARTAVESAGRTVLEGARGLVEQDFPDVEVHEALDFNDPRETLLELSEEAAMVVVGSRGLGPLRSLLLGSVGVSLVRHAHCPVVVVRPRPADAVRHGVLVGLDTSEVSRPVLELAFRQASLRGLPLTILHSTWDTYAATTGAYLVTDVLTDLESERLGLAEALAGMAEQYPDVSVTARLGRGRPEQVLVHASETAELVVVGAHQRGLARRAMTGSVSTSVVEHARSTVAVVPLHSPAAARP